MKILRRIIGRVHVNVVDDLTLHGGGNLSVLPLAPGSLQAVTQSLPFRRVRPVRLLGPRVRRYSRRHGRNGTLHQIPAALVETVTQAPFLARVGIERVAVTVPHLIVALAHTPRDRRTITMVAGTPDDLPAPPIFRRAVPGHALVVHQAIPVRSVLPPAFRDAASPVQFRRSHGGIPLQRRRGSISYKALGNSMAVPVLRDLITRIADVDRIIQSQRNEAA